MQEPFCIFLFLEFGFGSYLIERGGWTQYAFSQCWRGSWVGTDNIVRKDTWDFYLFISFNHLTFRKIYSITFESTLFYSFTVVLLTKARMDSDCGNGYLE